MEKFLMEKWILDILEENVKRTSDEFFEIQRIRDAFIRVEKFYKSMEDLHQLAIDAFNDVCTGGNPRPTSVEDIEALYHKAF